MLGAFVDLGVPVSYLSEKLHGLLLDGFSIIESKVKCHGISATDILVKAEETAVSRDFAAISNLISNSLLSNRVKEMSQGIFWKIADAEARIHGCPIERVHFHEVGGIDAIVDIVGTALCAEYLELETIIGAPVPLGRGFVTCHHGTLPVPAPATLEILKDVPIYGSGVSWEQVTPTGAAILTGLCSGFEILPEIKITGIGYGAGKRESEGLPNLLRVITGTKWSSPNVYPQDDVVSIETNIDDMNPEIFGFIMEKLFEAGALDVFWTPVYMKKNRPGTLVTLLSPGHLKEKLIYLLFKETTTAGVRSYEVKRHILHRESVSVDTVLGPIAAKRLVGPDGVARLTPEYEACRNIAVQRNLPLKEVYDVISRFLADS